jgi:putative salt-induced outer membrane protein YdiY
MRQFDLGGQFGRAKHKTNVNRWWVNGNVDHKLYEKWILFATTKNTYNQFTNLDYRGTLSGGLGYRFYNEKDKRLIVRVGPAVTFEIFQNEPFQRTTPDMFAEIETRWPLFDRTQFEQKSRVNPSMANLVRIVSTSSLLIDLDNSSRWKLRLSFRYEYDSQPAAGRLPSDYLSTVSLVYVRK